MKKLKKSFSILEVILAAGIFAIVATGAVSAMLHIFSANRLGEEMTVATEFASEGIEASRSIKNQGFSNLTNTLGTGIIKSGSVWTFSGTSNTLSKYNRVISISDVNRDGSGNIVASGGTLDPLTKKIQSTVNWNFGGSRNETVNLISYFTNWIAKKGGMLAYGDNASAADIVKYKIFDGTTWGSALNTADIDGTTTNRAVQVVRIYSSPTRNEKIILSRHYNGTTQYIYGQVFNGTAWGNVQLLSSWNATTFLDVQNFDGTYLANGTFMTVFSDNTVIPKMMTWNGTAWSSSSSLTTLGASQIPNYIVLKSRPGTNEAMAAFFTQGSDSITQYYSGSAWSAITTHATAAPLNTKQLIDFAWSPNNSLIGGLIFSDAGADKSLDIKIWTANGTGGGAWSALVNSSNQSNNIGALSIIGRPGANEFDACDKDSRNPPRIICYKSDFTPTWTDPTNQIVTTSSDTGIQRSFHLGFESQSGDPAIIVYSDNTAIPKFNKYNPSTSTWDATATNINTSPYTLGTVKTVRLIPSPESDDILVLLTDSNSDLYSVFWDGANNSMFTTPADLAFMQQGVNGSSVTNYWYDFVFDTL